MTSSERAYHEIRRRVLSLELPPGTELEEQTLVTELGVSRTPVREALIRLASEGLVLMSAGRSARVMPLEVTDLGGFFEALDLVSRAVNRLAALRCAPADMRAIEAAEEAFEAAAAGHDGVGMSEANHRFHEAVGAAAHNEHMLHSYRRLLTQSLRIVRVCFSAAPTAEDQRLEPHLARTQSDHRRMIAAIGAGEADAAEALAGEHCELFRARVATVLLDQPTELAPVSVSAASGA